jgi:hypothetical protein
MPLTKAKLTTSMGYVKYTTRNKAQRIAGKLGLSGTHNHEMQGRTIYMPGSNHRKLNRALRREGLPETMVPGKGMTGMGSGDDLDAAMMPDRSMMNTDLPDQPTQNYTADELDELVEPEFTDQVEDQLEGGLIDEDIATGVGLGVGDEDDDGEMEIY